MELMSLCLHKKYFTNQALSLTLLEKSLGAKSKETSNPGRFLE